MIAMQDIQITDAIVPIYCNNVFMGTGFLYKSYLITAEHIIREYDDGDYDVLNGKCIKVAHVTREYEKVEYEYKGTRCAIRYNDVIWSKNQFGDGRVFGFIDEDLAIIRLSMGIECMTMCMNDNIEGLYADLYGFHYYNDDDIRLTKRELKLSLSHICMNMHHITQGKCFYGNIIHEGDVVIGGYSGGPILRGKEILGMLVGRLSDSNTFHMMKSSYIFQQILNYEN